MQCSGIDGLAMVRSMPEWSMWFIKILQQCLCNNNENMADIQWRRGQSKHQCCAWFAMIHIIYYLPIIFKNIECNITFTLINVEWLLPSVGYASARPLCLSFPLPLPLPYVRCRPVCAPLARCSIYSDMWVCNIIHTIFAYRLISYHDVDELGLFDYWVSGFLAIFSGIPCKCTTNNVAFIGRMFLLWCARSVVVRSL